MANRVPGASDGALTATALPALATLMRVKTQRRRPPRAALPSAIGEVSPGRHARRSWASPATSLQPERPEQLPRRPVRPPVHLAPDLPFRQRTWAFRCCLPCAKRTCRPVQLASHTATCHHVAPLHRIRSNGARDDSSRITRPPSRRHQRHRPTPAPAVLAHGATAHGAGHCPRSPAYPLTTTTAPSRQSPPTASGAPRDPWAPRLARCGARRRCRGCTQRRRSSQDSTNDRQARPLRRSSPHHRR